MRDLRAARDRPRAGREDVTVRRARWRERGDVAEEDGYSRNAGRRGGEVVRRARGDQILASDVVRVLAGSRGGHQFMPVGALELKGLAEPLTAWDVAWSRDEARVGIPSRPPQGRGAGACVGRDDELEAVVTA